MTPEERAVIEAARALEPVLGELSACSYVDEHGVVRSYSGSPAKLKAAVPAFLAAVRALPRPLAERLAELRPGAVVELPSAGVVAVLANIPKFEVLFYERQSDWWSAGYEHITRIISNPEPGRE